jgi:uracil-DNA glycosylase
MPQIEIVLAIGRAAQDYHFARFGRPLPKGASLAGIVRASAEPSDGKPRLLALPHPSWRNNAWLKRNPWFEGEIVPLTRALVAEALAPLKAPAHP